MDHRIAILSDIHGDTTALEAVIADARSRCDFTGSGGHFVSPEEDHGSCWMDLITAAREINIVSSQRHWMASNGLRIREIQLRLTQYLMEGLDPKDRLVSFPSLVE